MAASSAQVVVKVTFGDEVRRLRVYTSLASSLPVFVSKLTDLFPQLQTILKQSPQLCVQLLLNEAPLTAEYVNMFCHFS